MENSDFNEQELKDRLREHAKDCAKKLREEDQPYWSLEVCLGESPNIERKEVKTPPRPVINPARRQEFVQDAAEWLYDTGTGPELSSTTQTNRAIAVGQYRIQVCNFFSEVFKYSGGFQVDEEAFEECFIRHWLPKYENDSREEYELVMPIRYFSHLSEDVELSSDVPIHVDSPEHHELLSLSIRNMDSPIWNAILTYESGNFTSKYHHQNDEQTILVAKLFGTELPDPPGKVGGLLVDRVVQALRLFKPSTSVVFPGPTYLIKEGWLDFRFGIPTIRNASPAPTSTPEKAMGIFDPYGYELQTEEIEDFVQFWKRNGQHVKRDYSDPLFSPLQRFREMYAKEYHGDRIVECMIALEGTLLSDMSRSASYTFRLGIRAPLLLEPLTQIERKEIRKFLENLYHARGEIVHQDRSPTDIVQDDQFNDYDFEGLSSLPEAESPENRARQFSLHARYFLANVILAYSHYGSEHGLSIQEVNEAIDDAARNASSPFNCPNVADLRGKH